MTRICVLTVAIGGDYAKATRLAVERKRAYCSKHGYKFVLLSKPISRRPPSWDKIKAAIWLLWMPTKFDWLFVSDADSLILNTDVRLESFLNSDANLIISRDANALNAGNFFIRSSAWASDFLRELWDLEQFINHPWWENAALMHAVTTNPAHMERIAVVDQNLFNSYVDTYRPGDFLIHFAGTREPAKLEALIAQWLKAPPQQ